MKRQISVVIPVFNEERNVPHIYEALDGVTKTEIANAYDWEFLFVNDGSKDGSLSALHALSSDSRVHVIEFTRNFGKELATTAGIHAATGDAIIMIDADMQHPPALIPEFIKQWEAGAEVVVGVRTKNKGEGPIKKYGSHLYYWIMRSISETEVIPGETDFRLIDRQVADAFNDLSEHQRMTRALINWLGFKKATVTFKASKRLHGEAAYSTGKLLHLAIHAFISNSLLPLRLAGYIGVFISVFSFLLGLAVFTQRYVFHDALSWHVSGTAQLAIINVFLVGIVLMSLGLIALYVGKITDEVTRRPLYVVRKSRNQ